MVAAEFRQPPHAATAASSRWRKIPSPRLSETADQIDPDSRLKPPRYWLVQTLAHILIRQLAMTCGYSAASLSERLYAWPESEGRPAAAGLLICTTASDSDGTLGGLVQLSEADRLGDQCQLLLERREWQCRVRRPSRQQQPG